MVTKEEVDNTFEIYERMITRAQHVYNRLYTELWKPYHIGSCDDHELFQAEMNGYDVKVRRGDKEDEIDFGTSGSDRYGDYIGYSTFKKEFLYNDEALTAYIESERQRRKKSYNVNANVLRMPVRRPQKRKKQKNVPLMSD